MPGQAGKPWPMQQLHRPASRCAPGALRAPCRASSCTPLPAKINYPFLLAESQRRHTEPKDAGSSANGKDAPRAGLHSCLDSLFPQLIVRLSELYVLFTMFLNSFNLS